MEASKLILYALLDYNYEIKYNKNMILKYKIFKRNNNTEGITKQYGYIFKILNKL